MGSRIVFVSYFVFFLQLKERSDRETDVDDDEEEDKAAIAMLQLMVVVVVASYSVDDNLLSECQVCEIAAGTLVFFRDTWVEKVIGCVLFLHRRRAVQSSLALE